MVSGNTSRSSGKTNAGSGRDNYVGGNISDLFGIEASNSQAWLSAMSMEISKPTRMLDGNSKQDTNNMPTAENNMLSDGMPLISNED
ncbi:MAG: hypothetical protein HFH43_10485 [Lachnospiraceae bacterium]|jgi:hypothetical protein|nr:hypothetical protein [Lachnospiraceae bacterium]MCI8883443.1 hypothetical protein [Lachnospiraceae bacterium]